MLDPGGDDREVWLLFFSRAEPALLVFCLLQFVFHLCGIVANQNTLSHCKTTGDTTKMILMAAVLLTVTAGVHFVLFNDPEDGDWYSVNGKKSKIYMVNF